MEMAVLGGDDDGEVEDLAYELLGVVVFERTGLEECRGCLWGFGSRRHREQCRHVEFRADIVVGEMEAERTDGLEKPARD
jgi:hypothetical protein